jgi:hypothetical protein
MDMAAKQDASGSATPSCCRRTRGSLGFIFRLGRIAANTLDTRHVGGSDVRNCRGGQVPMNGGCTKPCLWKAMDGFFDQDLRSGPAAK